MLKTTLSFLLLGAAAVLGGCDRPPTADTVLINGNIFTGEPGAPRAEALAITGGRIAALGATADIRTRIGDDTTVIDLDGGFAMPGFNDAHLHLDNAGQVLLDVNLVGSRSLAEFKDRIGAGPAGLEPGQWIIGRGWDQFLWPEQRVPTRADLDAVSSTHPIVMIRVDGHSAVVNSLALTRAGITAATKPPEGGAIIHDPQGEPTGELVDRAMGLVRSLVPKPGFEQHKRGLALALAEAARFGITSVQDDSVRGSGWTVFEALNALKAEGGLTARVTEWLPFDASLDELAAMVEAGGTTDPWLKTGMLKLNIDGSGGSLSAAMLAPYATAPDNAGLLIMAPDKLTALTIERDRAGYQIGLHAIGDRANRVVLDAFAAAQEANGGRDSRHRIEHAQFVAEPDVGRFAALGVIASVQPSHLLSDLRWAPDILGPQRIHEAYRWRSFLDAGVAVAFGTDYPVEVINPMRGLYAAVSREFEAGGPDGGWTPGEKITIEQAIAAYTLGAAYAEFEETRKGSLTVGKFADIVVLSRDITTATPSEILTTRARMTVVGGKVVYRRD